MIVGLRFRGWLMLERLARTFAPLFAVEENLRSSVVENRTEANEVNEVFLPRLPAPARDLSEFPPVKDFVLSAVFAVK